ncbi:hypothetical protein ABVT39_017922 [Epinephelus coioides]
MAREQFGCDMLTAGARDQATKLLMSKQKPFEAFDSLQEVEVPLMGENQCSCLFLPVPLVNITDAMICAGKQNKGVCQGDSGGPLQCKQDSQWVQAGITSVREQCALGNFPDVYARVSEFQAWIMEQVAGSNISFVTFNSSGTDQDDSFVCRSSNAATAAPNATATAAPNATATAAPNATATAAPTNASTASTVPAELTFIVILVTVFLQHIAAP